MSRGLFSEKTRIFLDFPAVLPACSLFHSARFVKNPQLSGKVPGDFRNSRESPEKISRNSRKFRPAGFWEKFPVFSGISGILGNTGVLHVRVVILNNVKRST
jgi:hypothetical protein